MRAYEQTHHWLTFSLPTPERFWPRLWLLLGESQSKVAHVAGVPLAPEVAERLHALYLAKGALATTAIEGNTLSEAQVRAQIAGELRLPPSQAYLGQEIANVVTACELIDHHILTGHAAPLCVDDVRLYNAAVLVNLPLPEEVTPGQFRTYEVGVGRYKAPLPEDVPFLMGRLCDWLGAAFAPPPGYESYGVAFSLLRAVVAHLYLAWIHPFGDGNGRTARLLEYRILLEAGAPRNAAHLLSNHYNQTRSEYYRQLDRASRSGGDILPFIEYGLQGLVDGLREQISVIQQQQLRVHWINFVHDAFRDHDTATDRRRRHLVLDLSEGHPEGVALADLRYVSPRMAEAYARKTDKTLQRDVNALVHMGLVERRGRQIIARTERMRAFLPLRVHPEVAPGTG